MTGLSQPLHGIGVRLVAGHWVSSNITTFCLNVRTDPVRCSTKMEQNGIKKARPDVTETEFHQYAEMVVARSQLSSGGKGARSCNTT